MYVELGLKLELRLNFVAFSFFSFLWFRHALLKLFRSTWFISAFFLSITIFSNVNKAIEHSFGCYAHKTQLKKFFSARAPFL